MLGRYQKNNPCIFFFFFSCRLVAIFSPSNPFFFLTPSVGLSCLQLVNSRVVDGIAFSAVRLHHAVATICGYSDMCGHRGKSMPQQRSQIRGLLRSAEIWTADFGSDLASHSSASNIYMTKENWMEISALSTGQILASNLTIWERVLTQVDMPSAFCATQDEVKILDLSTWRQIATFAGIDYSLLKSFS